MNQISAQQVVAQKSQRKEVATLNSDIFYLEKRPSENGRVTLMYNHKEILPKEYSIKSKVHEYGGGSYAVSSHFIIFANKKDQGLYIMDKDFKPRPLLIKKDCRFADGVIDEKNNCSYWVMESHTNNRITNKLVKIYHRKGKTFGRVNTLAQGDDFYSSPTFYKDNLAFISWNHPNMPWDETKLSLLNFKTKETSTIDQGTWISEPRFHSTGDLFYIKEEREYSNIFCYNNQEKKCVYESQKEYASPAWNFGNKSFVCYKDKVIATYWRDGQMGLEIIFKNTAENILKQYSGFSNLNISGEYLVLECESNNKESELVYYNLETKEEIVKIKADNPSHKVAIPKSIYFPSDDGTAQGFLYLPPNIKKEGNPAIIISHGGPTGINGPFYDISIQYWVDKGFCVFDVNYRGSTGFGKSYRNAIKGKWGQIDIADCVNAANYLVKNNIANPSQLIIRGESAGGYTTMAALTFTDTFCAGASYYGICDLNMLATSTHKFESHYMDSLIASFKDFPEEFEKRSPVNFLENIKCPMIIFQGEEDQVVPKNQSQTIHDNLKSLGIPTKLFIFEEEGHGFSKAENIITCLEQELEFYNNLFNK